MHYNTLLLVVIGVKIFIMVTQKVVTYYTWLCHSYCLVDNHYPLIIETLDGTLSKGMRQLIEEQYESRNAAIVTSYNTGAYSQREIGEYF